MPIPGIGHAFPMVPLAWALRAAGHDVLFLAGFDGVKVSNAGIPVVDVLPGITMEMEFAEVAADAPDIFESMAQLSIEQILALKPMAIGPWDRYADRYIEAAKQVDPDVIVYDPVFNAGMVAASVLDVPAIGHGYMLLRFGPDMLREHGAPAFERYQVDLPKKLATLEIGPASVMESGSSTWHVRYIPYGGGGVLPTWLSEPRERPRITVTLGTPLPHRSSTGRFDAILAAAREVDAEFALTVNEATAEALQPLPDNVRATGWVPLYELLQTSTAVIHHGGSGTMFTSCVAGIPQLIIPEGADNDYNARILRSYGNGLHVAPGKIDAAAINTLITDTGLQTAARELRHEIEQMRTPNDVVGEIVEFIRS